MLLCFIAPTPEEYRVPRVSPGATASKLFVPTSVAGYARPSSLVTDPFRMPRLFLSVTLKNSHPSTFGVLFSPIVAFNKSRCPSLSPCVCFLQLMGRSRETWFLLGSTSPARLPEGRRRVDGPWKSPRKRKCERPGGERRVGLARAPWSLTKSPSDDAGRSGRCGLGTLPPAHGADVSLLVWGWDERPLW